MKEKSQSQPHFQQQFDYQTIHRGKRYGKKRRSWVSFILTLIAAVFVTIAAYSMYSDTLFKMGFINENVTFDKLKVITTQLSSITLIDISAVEQKLSVLIKVLNVFFILSLINIVLALLTLIFNRTILKILNFIIAIFITLIPIGFLYYIDEVADEFAKQLAPYVGQVDASNLLTGANALHNAIIFMGIATFLYFISLFFRNRRPKIK